MLLVGTLIAALIVALGAWVLFRDPRTPAIAAIPAPACNSIAPAQTEAIPVVRPIDTLRVEA